MTAITTTQVATPRPAPIAPARPAKVRRPPVYPGSAQALAMLTLWPVFATPVPRLHVEPKAPDGRLIVYDRALGEQFAVYAPRFVSQFRGGHRAGQWYLRPVSDLGNTPRSRSFATARAAIEALTGGRWSLPSSPRYRPDPRLRVIWTAG
jgi:hypothetical protein